MTNKMTIRDPQAFANLLHKLGVEEVIDSSGGMEEDSSWGNRHFTMCLAAWTEYNNREAVIQFPLDGTYPWQWDFCARSQTISKEFESKRETVALLREFGVPKEELKQLNKVAVSKLVNVSDDDDTEDATTTVQTIIEKIEGVDWTFTGVFDGKEKPIRVTAEKKKGYSKTIEYRLEADWKGEIVRRSETVRMALQQKGINIIAGTLSV